MHLALAMAEFEQMAPLFQKLTRLLLHNVRYHPKVVSRKNLDDFIVMVQDPIRLAHVYDQLELLRHDLSGFWHNLLVHLYTDKKQEDGQHHCSRRSSLSCSVDEAST